MAAYLDASAFVKLIIREPESDALRRWLASRGQRTSSALLRAEVLRAVRLQDPSHIGRARELLDTLLLVPVDDGVLEAAGMLDPASMRSLDAIHVATARYLGSDLDALVTYDLRMIEGAKVLGLPTASPA